MGTEFFPRLGAHCSEPLCGTLDFLPFTCDACKQTFCLDHRSYKAHECSQGDRKDATVILCPNCNSSVRTQWGWDALHTLRLHQQSECDPTKHENAARKTKCPMRGCHESLTFSNRVRCRDCHRDVCLKHRFADDHSCAVPQNLRPKKDDISATPREIRNAKFLESLKKRMGTECGAATTSDSGDSAGAGQTHGTTVAAH